MEAQKVPSVYASSGSITRPRPRPRLAKERFRSSPISNISYYPNEISQPHKKQVLDASNRFGTHIIETEAVSSFGSGRKTRGKLMASRNGNLDTLPLS
jgi:hypothetical protein